MHKKAVGGAAPQAVGTVNPQARSLAPPEALTQPLKPQQSQK